MIRFAYQSGHLKLDTLQKAPGRGVYLHAQAICLSKMFETKLWERSLKRNTRITRDQIAEATDGVRGLFQII
jgi:predicted RNA-binding protein YlxR (DUF448 family)